MTAQEWFQIGDDNSAFRVEAGETVWVWYVYLLVRAHTQFYLGLIIWCKNITKPLFLQLPAR